MDFLIFLLNVALWVFQPAKARIPSVNFEGREQYCDYGEIFEREAEGSEKVIKPVQHYGKEHGGDFRLLVATKAHEKSAEPCAERVNENGAEKA